MSRPAARQSPPDHGVPVDAPIEARLTAAVAKYGEREVVDRAVALVSGANAGEEFLLWVGGRHARGILDGAPPLYWPEVWGARTLLHVWDPSAAVAVVASLADGAWRVREMCLRVVAERAVDASTQARALLTDEVPRVRAAAARALGAVGGADDTEAVSNLLTDPDIDVRRSAGAALERLRQGHPRANATDPEPA